MSTAAEIPGFIRLPAQHSVSLTVDRLEEMLRQKGILVFARIDFSGDAARAGLRMPPEELLIFGNPKAGTPLMQAAPPAGLDLPLKVLVWEASDGKVWVGYNDPKYVVHRHGLPETLSENLSAVVPIIESAAGY